MSESKDWRDPEGFKDWLEISLKFIFFGSIVLGVALLPIFLLVLLVMVIWKFLVVIIILAAVWLIGLVFYITIKVDPLAVSTHFEDNELREAREILEELREQEDNE